MEEVKATGMYAEFKESLDRDIRQQAEGFVRIGYKLKVARDTEILAESGYKTVAEFAKAEYGFSPDIVSRYIRINDRYSVDGYSETLKAEYQEYGYTKLAEMLTLPENIVGALDPAMTRQEIREVKQEIEEEQRVTDLEVIMEGQQEGQKELSMEGKAMHQYFHDRKEVFVALSPVIGNAEFSESDPDQVMDAVAPSGMAVVFARVQGVGKLMLSFRGTDTDIEIQNVRTMEGVKMGWAQFCRMLKDLFAGLDMSDPEKAWEEAYHEPYAGREKKEEKPEPKKPEGKEPEPPKPIKGQKEGKIAPAQKSGQKEEPKAETEPAEKQESTETSGEEPKKPEEDASEAKGQQAPIREDGQIEGQDSILNHKELLPDGYGVQGTETEAKVDGEPVKADVEPTDAQRKKRCEDLIEIIKGNFEMGNYTAALKYARELYGHLEVMAE